MPNEANTVAPVANVSSPLASTVPAPTPAQPATPAAAPVSAKPAKRQPVKRVAATKPATAKSGTPGQQAGSATSPNVKPAKPASGKAAKPVKPEATEAAKPSGNVTRTAATIARNATNFGGVLSDRDTAYLAFYATFAKRAPGKPITVRAIHESGRFPAYNGSAKPHDAGVINRLRKAGLLSVTIDGSAFTFTDKAKKLSAYTSAK